MSFYVMERRFIGLFLLFAITSAQICPNVKRDLIILLDSSGSVTESDFGQAKEFLTEFIDDLEVNADAFQVNVIQFSDSVRPLTRTHFSIYNNKKPQLLQDVRNIVHNGGSTAAHKAFKRALRYLKKYGRQDAKDQILILTDGESDKPEQTAEQVGKVKDSGVEVIAVGVGKGVSHAELTMMASSGDLVFLVDTYDDLDDIRSKLLTSSCGLTTTPTTTTTITTTTPTPTTTTTPPSTTISTITTVTTTTTLTTQTEYEYSTDVSSISWLNATESSWKESNDTEEQEQYALNPYRHFNSEAMNEAHREKKELLSSASKQWPEVVGYTVGAFALAAVSTGLVIFAIRKLQNRSRRRNDFLDTL